MTEGKPLDRRMHEGAASKWKPPLVWQLIHDWADEVTALEIERDELRKQVEELIDHFEPIPSVYHDLPF